MPASALAAGAWPMKVGISNGTRTQALEGVNQGDRVILPS